MFFKNQIPEVPLWVSNDGDSSDSWFYQQLARFASERLGAANNVVVTGEYPNPTADIVLPAKPVAFLGLTPANVGNGATYFSLWTENAVYLLVYDTAGPTYQTVIITANTLASTRIDNGDGTWTLDTSTYAYANDSFGTAYYAIFLQS